MIEAALFLAMAVMAVWLHWEFTNMNTKIAAFQTAVTTALDNIEKGIADLKAGALGADDEAALASVQSRAESIAASVAPPAPPTT